MENPIYKLYEKTDNALMYGVNKGVKAWNWTTGKTKTNLANSLLTVAPVFEGAGLLSINPVIGGIMIPMYLLVSHLNQKRNKEQEILEKKAAESQVMLNPENSYEKSNKKFGLLFAGSAVLNAIPGGRSENDTLRAVFGIGIGLRSASHYVMRADYLPPRKNVLSRAKDRLVKKLREVNLNPVPQPVPIPTRYQNR